MNDRFHFCLKFLNHQKEDALRMSSLLTKSMFFCSERLVRRCCYVKNGPVTGQTASGSVDLPSKQWKSMKIVTL